MNIDPTRNTIVFEIEHHGKKEPFIEQSPTQANDGIQTAWQIVQRKTGAQVAQ